MSTYDEITRARLLLAVPERATLAEIRSSYRKLIRKWHPDRCREEQSRCREMAARLNAAYKLLTAYCVAYKFSFTMEEVRNNYATDEEWWLHRFGDDPLWGKNTRK